MVGWVTAGLAAAFWAFVSPRIFGYGAREVVDAAGESADAGFFAALDEGRQFLNGILRGLIERDFACSESLCVVRFWRWLGGRLRFVYPGIQFGLVLVDASFQSGERLREILLRSGVSGSVC